MKTPRFNKHQNSKVKEDFKIAEKKPAQDELELRKIMSNHKGEIHRLEKEHQNKLNGSGAGGDTTLLERIKILEAKLEHMEEPQRLLEKKRTEVDKLRDLLNQRTAELEQVKHITHNQNNKFKNKAKPGTRHQTKISNTSNHFDIDDDKPQDSFDDDDDNEKDPDWMKTPRFNTLQNSKVKDLMPEVSAGPDDPSRFSCRVCSKSFNRQGLLNRHMWSHSDVKHYLCTFCGKGFNDTSDLKNHTRTHTGERPYNCNLARRLSPKVPILSSTASRSIECCTSTLTRSKEQRYHFKFTNSNFANMLLQVRL